MATKTKPSTKSTFLAALLSLLIPGLGHLYIGRYLRGLLWFLFDLGVAVVSQTSKPVLSLLFIIPFAAMGDAVGILRRGGGRPRGTSFTPKQILGLVLMLGSLLGVLLIGSAVSPQTISGSSYTSRTLGQGLDSTAMALPFLQGLRNNPPSLLADLIGVVVTLSLMAIGYKLFKSGTTVKGGSSKVYGQYSQEAFAQTLPKPVYALVVIVLAILLIGLVIGVSSVIIFNTQDGTLH